MNLQTGARAGAAPDPVDAIDTAALGSPVLALLALAAGLCASYPWLLWLTDTFSMGGWDRPLLSLPAAAVIGAGGLCLSRFFSRLPWRLSWIRAAILAGGFLLALGVWAGYHGSGAAAAWAGWPAYLAVNLFDLRQPYILSLFAALYFWRLGLARSGPYLYPGNLLASFSRGLVSLVALIILLHWQAPRLALPGLFALQQSLGAYLACFFIFALAALSLGHHRAFTVRVISRKRTLRAFYRHWLILLACLLGAITPGGFLAAGAVPFALWEYLRVLASRAAAFAALLIVYVAVPFAHLAGWAVTVLKAMMGESIDVEDFEPGGPGRPQIFTEEAARYIMSPQGQAVILWTLLALFLIAVLYFASRSIYRIRAAAAGGEPEEFHESLFQWRPPRLDWSRFRKGLRRPFGAALSGRLAPGRLISRAGGFKSVREIYRALLRETARHGLERFDPETPSEYRDRLRPHLPGAAAGLTAVTDRYILERYGERKHTPFEIGETAAAFEKIKSALTAEK